jgi:hypothetical protein
MKSIFSEDELRQRVKEAVITLNKEDAMHCAPIHSMEEILARKKADDLHLLARMVRIKYITKHKKAELAAKIAKEISAPGNLELLFFGLDFSRWMFFLTVSEKDEYVVDSVLPDYYDLSQNFGLMQLFCHEEKLIFVVPDEVKAGLKALDEDDFIAFKSFSEDVIRFASAAVNLYGALPISLLTELLEEEYKEVAVPEVLAILDQAEIRNEVFCLFEQNVVHRFFEDEDGEVCEEAVRALLENRAGRPRYRPSPEEFFQYADPDFTEALDECERLEEAIYEIVGDAKGLDHLIDDIAFACRVDAPVKDIFSILSDYNVEFRDTRDAEAVTQAIIALKNRSRSWLLFGHSPEELRKTGPKGMGSTGGRSVKPGSGEASSKIVPLFGHSPAESVKTGRNDPCPCGSGKKYKNCCGK